MYALIIGIVTLALVVVMIAGLWKVFQKAGQPGWAAIVPFYNLYILVKVAKKPVSYFILLMVLSLAGNVFNDPDMLWLIGIISLANLVVSGIVMVSLAQQFGKSAGYGIGLLLLPFIFLPMLGFGDAEYLDAETGMELEA
ncbi:MAG: DUF5684 domain-containing protein [Bacteroidota bacterium]